MAAFKIASRTDSYITSFLLLNKELAQFQLLFDVFFGRYNPFPINEGHFQKHHPTIELQCAYHDTNTYFGLCRNRSIKTVASPKEAFASDVALSNASFNPSIDRTTLIPLPPPRY
jgi:hypothetical protein